MVPPDHALPLNSFSITRATSALAGFSAARTPVPLGHPLDGLEPHGRACALPTRVEQEGVAEIKSGCDDAEVHQQPILEKESISSWSEGEGNSIFALYHQMALMMRSLLPSRAQKVFYMSPTLNHCQRHLNW